MARQAAGLNFGRRRQNRVAHHSAVVLQDADWKRGAVAVSTIRMLDSLWP